ncbi:MAG: hypothetical protein WD512_06440 [Candidatus Paceibacterota bacterium]
MLEQFEKHLKSINIDVASEKIKKYNQEITDATNLLENRGHKVITKKEYDRFHRQVDSTLKGFRESDIIKLNSFYAMDYFDEKEMKTYSKDIQSIIKKKLIDQLAHEIFDKDLLKIKEHDMFKDFSRRYSTELHIINPDWNKKSITNIIPTKVYPY